MKKIFAVMLIIFFLSPYFVISTEKTKELSAQDKYFLSETVAVDSIYFNSIPKVPNVFEEVPVFSDDSLTQKITRTLKPNDSFEIKNLVINSQSIPVFQLSDDTYIKASRQEIYDDSVLSLEDVTESYWVSSSFTVYDSPYTLKSHVVSTDISSYMKLTVTQKAQTMHGVYYKIDGKGWISETDLSVTDNRIQKVQEMLNQKYNKSNFSIYVKQLSTDNTAGINENNVMYSASVAKLAVLYAVQEKIQNGQLRLTDTFKYVPEVNQFDGAYDPSGSGKLPKEADNNDYSVDSLLQAITKSSDNVATNILSYYVLDKYSQNFTDDIQKISGNDWNMKQRNMSAKTAGNIIESIYNQNGTIVQYLSETEFDGTRISKDITSPVAHKIGDAYDYKHDVAIVYSDSPFILSIFTDKESYDDITNIANDVYAILK